MASLSSILESARQRARTIALPKGKAARVWQVSLQVTGGIRPGLRYTQNFPVAAVTEEEAIEVAYTQADRAGLTVLEFVGASASRYTVKR